MHNCILEEPLAKLHYKRILYVICPIRKGENLLSYWYSVLSKETYEQLVYSNTVEEYEKYENELTDKAIDIRKLKNYDASISMTQIFFHRKEIIVPLIREAIRKEYIKPL